MSTVLQSVYGSKEEGENMNAIATREIKAVTIDDAAKMTSLGKSTIIRLIREGKLKATRIGKRVVIPVPEIEKLISPSR
jgi:excisionase family DNA binding protein